MTIAIIIGAAFVWGAWVLLANWLAQKIKPTKVSDPLEDRIIYRMLVLILALGPVAALTVVLSRSARW